VQRDYISLPACLHVRTRIPHGNSKNNDNRQVPSVGVILRPKVKVAESEWFCLSSASSYRQGFHKQNFYSLEMLTGYDNLHNLSLSVHRNEIINKINQNFRSGVSLYILKAN